MYNQEVISYLTQKKDGTSPIYFAPELHFVKPLKYSGVNNLEEQLLLGINKKTETWEEDGVTREFTIFKEDNDEITNYYVLDSRIYDGAGGSTDSEVYIANGVLAFNKVPAVVRYEGPADNTTLVDVIDNGYFTIKDNSLVINAPYVSREDRLLFHKFERDADRYYLVARRSIKKTYKEINNILRVVTEENITKGNYVEVTL